MNNLSPLRKAMAARGADRRLSPDFSADMMLRIAAMEQRRRRIGALWTLVGCMAALGVAMGTLVYFWNDIFAGIAGETVAMFRSAAPFSLYLTVMICLSVALLMGLDSMLRRRVERRRGVPSE